MNTYSHDQRQNDPNVEPLADLLRRRGAKQIRAWTLPAEPTPESKRKAKQRARQEQNGETQINFTMTSDKDARATVRAVAAAVKDPQIRSSVAAVATGDQFLQRIVDLTKIIGENLEDDVGYGQTGRESREWLRSVIEIVIDNEVVFELIRQILAEPTLAKLLVEIAQRQELKELVAATIDRPNLAETLSAVSKVEDNTLLCIAYVIRSPSLVEAVRNAESNLSLRSAVASAIRSPKAVLSFTSVLDLGGTKARILRWFLGL